MAVERKLAPARPLWAMWDRVQFPPVEWLVDCDVFHATNFIAPPSRKVPVVVTVHDIGFVHHPEAVPPGVRRMARLLPDILRRAAAIITVSEFTREELLDWLPEVADKHHRVHNGSHARELATGAGRSPPQRPRTPSCSAPSSPARTCPSPSTPSASCASAASTSAWCWPAGAAA